MNAALSAIAIFTPRPPVERSEAIVRAGEAVAEIGDALCQARDCVSCESGASSGVDVGHPV